MFLKSETEMKCSGKSCRLACTEEAGRALVSLRTLARVLLDEFGLGECDLSPFPQQPSKYIIQSDKTMAKSLKQMAPNLGRMPVPALRYKGSMHVICPGPSQRRRGPTVKGFQLADVQSFSYLTPNEKSGSVLRDDTRSLHQGGEMTGYVVVGCGG